MTLNRFTLEKLTGGSIVTSSEEAWETLEKKKFVFVMAKVDKLTTASLRRDYGKRIARIPKLRSIIRIFLGRYLWLPLSEEEIIAKIENKI